MSFQPEQTTRAAPTGEAIDTLLAMLRYKRAAGSKAELSFIAKFITPLDGWIDGYGNQWVQVGESPSILWSSHTDTVHAKGGAQRVLVDHDGFASAIGSDCLGADCAAGVWIMREMILAGVPGLYIFHRDEESGGQGSRYIAKHYEEAFKSIDFAVAFDRKGYDSVITHQGYRTASDAFANSLASILGGAYAPDDTGLFTDTANYTDIIGECSNVSVGYFKAHGPKESLDLNFVSGLKDRIIAADFSSLVKSRQAGEQDEDAYGHWWDRDYRSGDNAPAYGSHGREAILRFCEDHPDMVADFLDCGGHTIDDLLDWAGYEPVDGKASGGWQDTH
jgi:hypothetical protein